MGCVLSGRSCTWGVLAASALLVVACDSSPTAPPRVDVTGRWTGSLPLRMPDEDWSIAEAILAQSGESVTGTLVSRNGVRYPLAGTVTRDGGRLVVGGLPGTSTCSAIQLEITRLQPTAGRVHRLSGHLSGRCYGTVAGAFDLDRVG